MNRTTLVKWVQTGLKAAIIAAFSILAAPTMAEDVPLATDSRAPVEIEIKLLQAEMALLDGRIAVARDLLRAVKPYLGHNPAFRSRWKALMAQVEQVPPSPSVSISENLRNTFSCQKSYIALLPLSGPLEEAGQVILHALKEADCVPLDTLDTELFDMEALRQMVALYQPQWVLGPLRSDRIQAWVEQLPAWPTLLLGRMPRSTSCVNCVALSMGPVDQLRHLMPHLPVSEPRLVLLPQAFRSERLPDPSPTEKRAFYKHPLNRSLAQFLGVDASRKRIGYLQHLLHHPLQSVPRARRDLKTTLFVGSLDDAQQTAALLQFWQVPTRFIWVPTHLNPAVPRVLTDTIWPPMVVILPPFLWKIDQENLETGMFRALGHSVAIRLKADPAEIVMTPLGRLQWKEKTLNVHFIPYGHTRGRRWQPLKRAATVE